MTINLLKLRDQPNFNLSSVAYYSKAKGLAKLGNIVGEHGQNANVAQMLPSLATVSADKSIRKCVAEMFLHAQTFVGNICRSV